MPSGSDPGGWLGPRRSAARRAPRRGFKPPPPGGAQPIGSSTTTVTSPRPERQLLGGALTLRVSPGTRPHKLPLRPRSQLESSRLPQALRERPPGGDRSPPTKLRRGSSRGATGHTGDGQNPRPSESDPGRGRAATYASPLGHGPAGLRPTHPARWRAGRGPKQAYSPAPALTHLSASPCRRARRCRVPLCTLRTQTNPPPAPVPPPASP